MNILVVFAACVVDKYHGKEGSHIWICQTEIDLDRGFVKRRLNFA